MTLYIQKLQPPALPQGMDAYVRSYQDQLNNVHRLFYNRLTQSFNGLISPGTPSFAPGGTNLYFPYAAVQRTTDKTFTVNTATLITFDQNDYLSGCTNDGTDGIVVNQAGIYNYQFSVQWKNAIAQEQFGWIWLQKNGDDVPGTASRFSVPSKHAGGDGHLIGAANFFIQLAAGDYVSMYAAVDSVDVTMDAVAAQTIPWEMPAIPSVVATLSFVSNV